MMATAKFHGTSFRVLLMGTECYVDSFLMAVFIGLVCVDTLLLCCSFDFANETTQPVPPPVRLTHIMVEQHFWSRIGVLDGCLVVCCRFSL